MKGDGPRVLGADKEHLSHPRRMHLERTSRGGDAYLGKWVKVLQQNEGHEQSLGDKT